MNIIWLGQAGFALEHKGKTCLIDPYLSDACAKLNPNSWRRTPIDAHWLTVKPDAIVLTHDHIDHTDMETLSSFLPGQGGTLVLAAANAWTRVRALGGGNNYVRMTPGARWSWEGLVFSAVSADHSDADAIGIIVDDGTRKYYFTGDTLYNETIFPQLPDDLYAVFLPINGVGNNMNPTDAAAFAARTGATYSVPVHFGMFDSLDPTCYTAPNRIIPVAYQAVFDRTDGE